MSRSVPAEPHIAHLPDAHRHGTRYIAAMPEIEAALPPAMRDLRWHGLRHTCASLSMAISPNLHVVKERLGHEDIRTTINIYGHLLPSVDEALATALDGLHTAPVPASNVTTLRAPTEA